MPVKGLKIYRIKGRTYVYDRETGARLTQPLGTPEFLAELAAVRGFERAPITGSLGEAIARYKADDAWWGPLAPATRRSYERAFAAVEALRDTPLSAMTRPEILRLRDEVLKPRHGRWLANYTVTVLGVIFAFALDKGLLAASPLAERVRKIRKPRGAPVVNRPWTAAERAVVLAAAAAHVRLPLALAMCTGLRKTDVFSVTLGALGKGAISVRTSKRDKLVRLPIHPLLASALAERPKSDALQICVKRDGAPWTPDGFDTVWDRLKKRLETAGEVGPGLTLHGLRHTLGTLLKEAGVDDGSIADVLGQSGTAMARHYSREAELPKQTRDKIVNLDLAGKHR